MSERIIYLRRLLIIHSFIYYRLMTSVVTDDKWQSWAEELKVLQADGPVTTGYFDEDFKDWTGDTGMHLLSRTVGTQHGSVRGLPTREVPPHLKPHSCITKPFNPRIRT